MNFLQGGMFNIGGGIQSGTGNLLSGLFRGLMHPMNNNSGTDVNSMPMPNSNNSMSNNPGQNIFNSFLGGSTSLFADFQSKGFQNGFGGNKMAGYLQPFADAYGMSWLPGGQGVANAAGGVFDMLFSLGGGGNNSNNSTGVPPLQNVFPGLYNARWYG